MKKLIVWIRTLSNGEVAIYFGLLPTFLIAPIIQFIWENELSYIERVLSIGSVLLLLIIVISAVYFWIKNSAKKYAYDIFISYRTRQIEWVEILAKNLQQQGYEIFFDRWDIRAGQKRAQTVGQAIRSSHFVLLIISPDDRESAKEQYKSLLQQQGKAEFSLIPITVCTPLTAPLFEDIPIIDFEDSQKDDYAKAFQRLDCALKKQPSGANPYFSGALEIAAYQSKAPPTAPAQTINFLNDIFNYLEMGSAVMVLRQADSTSQYYSTALLKKAKKMFGEEQCLHLVPPNNADSSKEAYFSRLSQQCGFDEYETSAWQWAETLGQRLQQDDQPLCMIITSFEQGSDTARQDLAGELRGLLDRFPLQLKLVIFGAEKLAALKYQNGNLSLLNQLEEKRLPELDADNLHTLFTKHYPNLNDQSLVELLRFTGQHPKLVHTCLQNKVYTAHACEDYLSNSDLPSQLYIPFQNDNQALLCQYLHQQEICHYSAWPQDRLVRKLYWHNLIKQSNNKFIWRSAYIQTIGKQYLACDY